MSGIASACSGRARRKRRFPAAQAPGLQDADCQGLRSLHGATALAIGKHVCIVRIPVTQLSDSSTFMRF